MVETSELKIPFTWEERRPVFLHRFFYIPPVYLHFEAIFSWRDLFDNDLPVCVEYCSGNGQWIADRALENPDRNWVAVEKRFDRSRKIWKKIEAGSISNLYVICGEAKALTRFYLPRESITEVFINFPDPWPKFRHSKHRLVVKEFLDDLSKVVLPGAKVTSVTDDKAYAAQIINEFEHSDGWMPLEGTYDLKEYGQSYFGDLWTEKGRSIHFISHERRR